MHPYPEEAKLCALVSLDFVSSNEPHEPSPDISSVSSRGVLSPFVARHVRFTTAGVFLHVEDRGPKHNAAMEGLRPPQQKRMKYAGQPLINRAGSLAGLGD
jgi:hypothetical protein